MTSLDDMRRFILEHSDFSRAQGNVTKHVNIVTQLSEVVGARHLMDVSTVSSCWALLLLLLAVSLEHSNPQHDACGAAARALQWRLRVQCA